MGREEHRSAPLSSALTVASSVTRTVRPPLAWSYLMMHRVARGAASTRRAARAAKVSQSATFILCLFGDGAQQKRVQHERAEAGRERAFCIFSFFFFLAEKA